jgi:hypothetical protein
MAGTAVRAIRCIEKYQQVCAQNHSSENGDIDDAWRLKYDVR